MIYEVMCYTDGGAHRSAIFLNKENAIAFLKEKRKEHSYRCDIYDETETSFKSVQRSWMETTVTFKIVETKANDEVGI